MKASAPSSVLPQSIPMLDFSSLACRFRQKDLLGSGMFGSVFRGHCNHTPVAIKTTATNSNHDASQFLYDSLIKEMQIMQLKRHPNICLLLGLSYGPPPAGHELKDIIGSSASTSNNAGEAPRPSTELIDQAVSLFSFETDMQREFFSTPTPLLDDDQEDGAHNTDDQGNIDNKKNNDMIKNEDDVDDKEEEEEEEKEEPEKTNQNKKESLKSVLYLVTELMEGNLLQWLTIAPRPTFDRLEAITQIARGLNWLHHCDPPIVHLDLKLENVLYDRHGTIKLADFGLSSVLRDSTQFLQFCRSPGNLAHMAPEVIKRQSFSTQADVFSFGVLAWEIITGRLWKSEAVRLLQVVEQAAATATDDETTFDTSALSLLFRERIGTQALRPPTPLHWPLLLKRLVTSCWHSEPSRRPSIDLVLKGLPHVLLQVRLVVIRTHLLYDPFACEFWSEHFAKFTVEFSTTFAGDTAIDGGQGSDRSFGAPWEPFIHTFCRFLNVPDGVDGLPKQKLLLLQLAFNAAKERSPVVTFQRFCRIALCFGPFDSADVIERIADLLSRRWFHPTLTGTKAASYLQGQPPGTFVVRFSDHPTVPFTLSWLSSDSPTKLLQTRIYAVRPNVYRLGDWDINFDSVAEIFENTQVCAALKLVHYIPCPISPGQRIMLEPLSVTGYTDDLGPNLKELGKEIDAAVYQ